MGKEINHEPDVLKVISEMSNLVGNCYSERFNIDSFYECHELKIESVIEKIFYVAFRCAVKICGPNDQSFVSCEISPQKTIGKYRVDFLVSKINWPEEKTLRHAIVECDGHEFHDRDETQRRYEKQRDRWLQSQGHRIFHFTGKEIKDNPISCACEVLAYVSDYPKEDLIEEICLFKHE